MELHELWWRALDPCCCLAFLCWFHASFIIHFHTKQTTLSMSAMRMSLSLSLSPPSLPLSVALLSFHFLSSSLTKLLSSITFLSILSLYLPLCPGVLPYLLFSCPLIFFSSSWVFLTYCKWLHLFLINILLQHPVDINSLLRCCRATSEFSPRARIQLLLFSWFPALPLSWTESHGCVIPVSLVKLSIFFFHFLLCFSVFHLQMDLEYVCLGQGRVLRPLSKHLHSHFNSWLPQFSSSCYVKGKDKPSVYFSVEMSTTWPSPAPGPQTTI